MPARRCNAELIGYNTPMEDKILRLIATYAPSPEAIAVVQKTPLLLLVGITGAGKDTVSTHLESRGGFHRIVSHTTRPPRENLGVMEVDGHHYHFITLDEAARMLEQQAFVEAKYVHGKVYGTSVAEFEKIAAESAVAMTDLDFQGVREYLAIKPDTHAIFLLPPSVEEWTRRLTTRYGDLARHMAEVRVRFETAQRELREVMQDDRFVIVVNDNLEQTIDRVVGVVTGTIDHTSDRAHDIAEELLAYVNQQLGTH